ncbi:SDR family oxidoreductase [Streptomyces phaeochromogenes]|uniref:SDR family oxidoreductase n=1 Tax=Streptomyces phaeochromogenes TaxID=1923 RepID=UPI003404D88F
MKMTGNTILITGGTSGIGLGLALRLHEAGNKVIVAGRRKELLDRITSEHPGIEALVLDVADPASIARAAESAATSHPQLNLLVNNAGIMLPENLLDPASLPVAEDHVTVNLLGTIRMTYAFLPLLEDKSDAVVMNVTSALAFVPLPITPTYNATKAALHSFSEMNTKSPPHGSSPPGSTWCDGCPEPTSSRGVHITRRERRGGIRGSPSVRDRLAVPGPGC